MTTGTVARTAVLLIALINQVLVLCGINTLPVEQEAITQWVSMTFTAVASLAAWWKNNSFTTAAIEGDKVMKELKKKQ